MSFRRVNTCAQELQVWTPLFTRTVMVSYLVIILSQCILAGAPIYIQKIGAPSFYSGMLITLYMISMVIVRSASGALVDRFSRRFIVMVGSTAMLLGCLMPLVADGMAIQVCSKILQGLGFSSVHTAASSSVTDILPKERIGEGIGYSTLGSALSMTLGPFIALWLMGFESIEVFSIGTTIMAAVMLVCGLSIRYERNPQSLPPTAGYRVVWEERQKALVNGMAHDLVRTAIADSVSAASVSAAKKRIKFFELAALRGGIPVFLLSIGLTVFTVYTAAYLLEAGFSNPSLFFGIGAIVAFLVRLFMSRLLNTPHLVRLLVLPAICGVLTLLGVYFTANEIVFYTLGIGYGICVGASAPLLNVMAIEASPPENYGPANALFYLMYDSGIAVGALVWSIVFGAYGYLPLYVGGAGWVALALIVALALFARPRS